MSKKIVETLNKSVVLSKLEPVQGKNGMRDYRFMLNSGDNEISIVITSDGKFIYKDEILDTVFIK